MPFNNITARSGSSALVPEEVSNEMLGRSRTSSAVLQLFHRIPVSRNQVRFPVLTALPLAYWVTGDTGLKQTTEMSWANKYMNVEEIAVITPIPDNVLSDILDSSGTDLFSTVMPDVAEAFGRTLDNAVLFGVNAPASFPNNVSASTVLVSNTTSVGKTAAQGSIYGDIDAVTGTLENDGYDPNGIIAARSLRAQFRAARSTLGERLDPGRTNSTFTEFDGMPVAYPVRGLWPTGTGAPVLIEGDWSQFVVGVRQDVTATLSKEAVIQDQTGAIVYNAFQQDLTFLRLTFRVGWQVANKINYDQPIEGLRYPAARLVA